MIQSGVYIISCKKSIRVYIGSAFNLKTREKKHFKDLQLNKHQNKLQNAYNKYGKENFIFEILEYIEDKTKLLEREQFYLDTILFASEKDKRFDKLAYNICRIAGSSLGVKRSIISRKKNSIITINKWKDNDYRMRTVNSMKLRKDSDTARKNKSNAAKNKQKTEQHIINQANSHRGAIHKKQKLFQCIFCKEFHTISNLKQHHNDNCKLNINQSQLYIQQQLLRNQKRKLKMIEYHEQRRLKEK